MTGVRLRSIGIGLATLVLAGCATTTFKSTWKAPDAQPLGSLAGQKVIALVQHGDAGARRTAEDALASEITARGAQGVPAYTLLPEADTRDEARARPVFEQSGAVAVVVMRPVGVDKEASATPLYTGPSYGGLWGGAYGSGWGAPWGGWSGTPSATPLRTDTYVTVETLVYSLKQNKLVWAARTETLNPPAADAFVREVASVTVAEMKKQGLF